MQLVQLDRPVPHQEPADCVRTFVFMANLASQEASGDPASSISVERVISRLRGSRESDSVLLGLVPGDAVPPDAPISPLGHPLIPSTRPAGADAPGVEDPVYDVLGFVHLSLPQLEERQVLEFEVVLDADLQPLPGQDLSGSARLVIAELLEAVEHAARHYERSVLQLWIMHPTDQPPGTGPMARLLEGHGYRLGLREVQSMIEVPESAPAAVRAGYRVQAVADYRVPAELVDDVAALLSAASIDVPHGSMTAEKAEWDAGRLTDAARRLADRGGRHLLVLLIDPDGRAQAMTEFMWHAGSHPEVIEQGVTFVAAGRRGRGLGRAVKRWGLAALRLAWPQAERVYASNAAENGAMLAINSALGMAPISSSSAWEKRL